MISYILAYKYFILFPFAVVEGPFTMMISGLFVKLGYLNFFYAFILLMTGDLLGDMLWYGLGFKFGMPFVKKFGKFFNITEEKISKVEHIFHKFQSAILFVSKITMGFGFALATLVTAGLVKLSFKKFVFWNSLGGIVWTATLMSVGFYFGNFYLKLNSVLSKIGFFGLFVMIFILLINVAHYVRKELLAKKTV